MLLILGSVLILRFSAGASRSEHYQRAARLSQHISVQAAGRGNAWINLNDGAARMVRALETNQAEPLALATGDFEEGGVPDLVCGYRTASGGIVALHGGNLDSIYPNSPEAQQRKQERAERGDNGSGRIYTITITCTDTDNNSSVRTVTVSVPRDQS